MFPSLSRALRGCLFALALGAGVGLAGAALADQQALDLPQSTSSSAAPAETSSPPATTTTETPAAVPLSPPAAAPAETAAPAMSTTDTTTAASSSMPASAGVAAAPPPSTEEVMSAGTVADYHLGPGDQLRVTVFGESDLTGLFQVGSQGSIAYPLVGEVQASGLTIPEFTDRLRAALMAYIRAPNVSVEVANYRPFFILGEVQRPGTYPYSANLTVQNAVATAGGFTYRANRGRVYIRHANEAAEHALRLDSSTPVMPGDTVRIGERFF